MATQVKQALPSDDKRWRVVAAAMRRYGNSPDALIETLHSAQSAFGFLDDVALRFISDQLHVPLSKVYGVATFYHAFSMKPEGKHRCVLCQGTACYIKGSQALQEVIEKKYDIKPGETSEDGEVSLLSARCIGACSLAPAAFLDDGIVGFLTPERLDEITEGWAKNE
jgi:bidirectional [NiFe] hydrogenase diaphorase subunit